MPTGTIIDDTSVSGITATWSGALSYGSFSSHVSRFWVKEGSLGDGVVFTDITPPSSGTGASFRSGAMLGSRIAAARDRDAGFFQAFDGRASGFQQGMAAQLPVTVHAGDCLIIARSFDVPFGGSKPQYIDAYLIIHVIAADADDPAPDALAPPYLRVAGFDPGRYSDIDLGARLPDKGYTPPAALPDIATLELAVSRTHMDILRTWKTNELKASYERINYGEHEAKRWGNAMLLASLIDAKDADIATPGKTDPSRRTALVMGILQLGIDVCGLTKAGRRPYCNGAHQIGLSLLCAWASAVLSKPEMCSHFPGVPGKLIFAEHGKTFFLTESDVGRDVLVRRSGTAQAATSNTITLAADDPSTGTGSFSRKFRQMIGVTLRILSGTGAGQTRIIASNLAVGSLVVTIVGTWDVTPDATSVYLIDSWQEDAVGKAECGIIHDLNPTHDNPCLQSEYRARAMNAVMGQVLAVCAVGGAGRLRWPALIAYCNRNIVEGLHYYSSDAFGSGPMTPFAKQMCDLAWATEVTSPTAGHIGIGTFTPPEGDAP